MQIRIQIRSCPITRQREKINCEEVAKIVLLLKVVAVSRYWWLWWPVRKAFKKFLHQTFLWSPMLLWCQWPLTGCCFKHWFCATFILTSYCLFIQVVLILILIDVQYFQKIVLSFVKVSNVRNNSSPNSHYPVKNSLDKIFNFPHPLMLFGKPCITNIWRNCHVRKKIFPKMNLEISVISPWKKWVNVSFNVNLFWRYISVILLWFTSHLKNFLFICLIYITIF